MESINSTQSTREYNRYNIMTPLNWLCGTFIVSLLTAGGYTYNSWFGIFCAVLIVSILIFYMGVYLYFAVKHPNRLQTEKFNLEMEKLNYLKTNSLDLRVGDQPMVSISQD